VTGDCRISAVNPSRSARKHLKERAFGALARRLQEAVQDILATVSFDMQIARTHPIMVAAAAAVLLLGLLGAAAISGVLPVAVSKRADSASLVQRIASPQPRLAQAARCTTCGVVEAIRTVAVQGEASGAGVTAGGFAGHQIEKHTKKSTAWRITVRLDDGSVRTLSQPAAPPFAVGDRVRIVNGSGVQRT
jgi:hypothetical protein